VLTASNAVFEREPGQPLQAGQRIVVRDSAARGATQAFSILISANAVSMFTSTIGGNVAVN
jgi:hypothetical protein